MARILITNDAGTVTAEITDVDDADYGSLYEVTCRTETCHRPPASGPFDSRDEAIEEAITHVNRDH